MDANGLLGIAGLAGYIIAVSGLLYTILMYSIKPTGRRVTESSFTNLYKGLASGSLLHNALLIYKHLQWSYENYYNNLGYTVVGSQFERVSYWLANTSIFREIYARASDGTASYWWLENLALFTAGGWTVFLATEGRKQKIPHLWAYMALAQLLAASTALTLFLIALSYRASKPKPIPSKKKDDINAVLPPDEDITAPLQVTLPVLLGLFAVATWPSSESPNFLPILLGLHAVLFVPVLPSPLWTTQPSFFNEPVKLVYFAITALCLILRLQTTLGLAESLPEPGLGKFAIALAKSLSSHPAAAIIGWDTIWTTVTFLTWSIYGDGTSKPRNQFILPAVSSTAVLGIGFTAPMALGNVIYEMLAEPEKAPKPATR